MKVCMLCGLFGGMAFLGMGYQMDLFDGIPQAAGDAEVVVKEQKKPSQPKLLFPGDLAPVARYEAVPQAAGFNPKNKTHRLAILRSSGVLHEDWQQSLKEEWLAENVEETELVVVVKKQTKTMVSHHTYSGGAPPITRFRWDLEVCLVDAKTGEVQAIRQFQNKPRELQLKELWDTTTIGSPVEFRSVFNWVASVCRNGLSVGNDAPPIVNVAD